ncbi:MAG: PEP-CTERM sorting domain-containing protein [Caldimonas sp.]
MTKTIGSILGVAALAACTTASAGVTGSLGGGSGTFLALSSAGLAGGSVATLAGGTVYTSDQPFADIPKGTVTDFLAVGVQAGEPATLTFTTPVSDLSFLWGSPDLYNLLTIVSTDITQMFTVMDLGFGVTNGNQAFSQYVQFASAPGSRITGVIFNNTPANDAFEVANFSVAAVPESSTFALLAAGLGVIGLVVRRRRRVA